MDRAMYENLKMRDFDTRRYLRACRSLGVTLEEGLRTPSFRFDEFFLVAEKGNIIQKAVMRQVLKDNDQTNYATGFRPITLSSGNWRGYGFYAVENNFNVFSVPCSLLEYPIGFRILGADTLRCDFQYHKKEEKKYPIRSGYSPEIHKEIHLLKHKRLVPIEWEVIYDACDVCDHIDGCEWCQECHYTWKERKKRGDKIPKGTRRYATLFIDKTVAGGAA